MISENIIKQQFIVDTLKKGGDIFYLREMDRFQKYLKSKSGETERVLISKSISIAASNSLFQLSGTITKQLRFQDFEKRKLYTRPFHAVFHQTWRTLQYGLHESIKEAIKTDLENAVNPE